MKDKTADHKRVTGVERKPIKADRYPSRRILPWRAACNISSSMVSINGVCVKYRGNRLPTRGVMASPLKEQPPNANNCVRGMAASLHEPCVVQRRRRTSDAPTTTCLPNDVWYDGEKKRWARVAFLIRPNTVRFTG